MQLFKILIKQIKKMLITKMLTTSFSQVYILFLLLHLQSCNNLSVQEDVVARVGDQYLYRSEIEASLAPFVSSKDSTQRVRGYIKEWALKRILFQQALLNLSETDIKQLNKLTESYKYDLFNTTYKERVVAVNLDTLVDQKRIDSMYMKKKNLFVLNKPLYQLQFLVVPINNVQLKNIRESFNRFSQEDIQFLDSLSFQFSRYSYQDSLWVNQNVLREKLPFLEDNNLKLYLKKGITFEVEEALDVYLFRFLDLRARGEIAPLEQTETTIKSIILSQQKKNFFEEFDKDLLKDAIQTKKFETY